MIRRRFLILGGLALSAGGSLIAADAPAAKEPAVEKEKDGSISLFDGKTLKNWKVANFAGGGAVLVKDGQLVLEMGQPMTGVTWDGKDLPKVDYEISFEAQRVDGSDFFVGLTFQVNESPLSLILGGWGGALVGFSSINGMDASENETTNFMKIDKGKWYKIRLRVSEARVDAFVDDKRVAGFDYREKKLGVRIEVEMSRPLGFATYNTTSAIKNLKLRELTADERKQAVVDADKEKAEKEQ
jgi:hypothetical protein